MSEEARDLFIKFASRESNHRNTNLFCCPEEIQIYLDHGIDESLIEATNIEYLEYFYLGIDMSNDCDFTLLEQIKIHKLECKRELLDNQRSKDPKNKNQVDELYDILFHHYKIHDMMGRVDIQHYDDEIEKMIQEKKQKQN